MSGRGEGQLPCRRGGVAGDEDRSALRRQFVGRPHDRVFGGVARGERQHGKTAADDGNGTVHDFGGTVGLGVDRGRLLEFQRRLAGDGERGAAAEDEERFMPVRRFAKRAPVAIARRLELTGEGGQRAAQAIVLDALGKQREAGNDGIHEGLGGGDAAFGSRKDVDDLVAGCRQRRVGGIGQGNGKCTAFPCRLRHLHDVGALARLRNGDAGGAIELQPRAEDRGDGRAERSDGNAGGKFGRVFQIVRGMVGRAARHRRDQSRILVAQPPAGSGDRGGGAVEERRHRVRYAGDLLLHESRCVHLPVPLPAVAEPEFRDEVVGIAPIARARELDHLA